MKKLVLLPLLALALCLKAETYTVNSPDKSISIRVRTTDQIYYAVDFNGKEIMWYSPLSMTLGSGQTLGHDPILKTQKTTSNNETIKTVWGIRNQIHNHYNQLELTFEGNYSVIFRAFNDGVAYRFKTDIDGEIIVKSEEVSHRFLKDHDLVAHVVGDFQTSYEKLYTRYKISEVVEKEFISLPLIVKQPNVRIAITESDLFDYPGMYVKRPGNNDRFFLEGLFPQYPIKWERGGWLQFNLKVTERADYLAKTTGKRVFPWRVMAIGEEDIDLADNDLVYQLARPAVIETDWIKSGKAAWEWWNYWNLEGVDFEAGVNNKTYEYYIDFAAKNGIEYVILDEGWSDQFDLMLEKPNIDVAHLSAYAKEKGVRLILWCVWYPLDRNMDAILDQFEKWDIAGIKVDFMDRDDQIVVNYLERLANAAAKRKLLVDYHGCSKPTGLHRTYPNVINYEGVRGNEYNKFNKDETPSHNIDIVFTRMLAGPMDYTPGAMNNSTKGNFQTNNTNPMSYGTRAHQLGMYVVYYGPLQMLCDAPTQYEKYPDILEFLSSVPVSWDETIALEGKMGEYVAIARRKGNDWYIGALNNWNDRTLNIDLPFLANGSYTAQMFLDGVNANRHAEDYQVKTRKLTRRDNLTIDLKSGGGAAIWLKK